ncbi:Zn-dependent protease [Hypnocyclicus thermotrophus]|uniref:Zn-dependent protease n=1 Tax=Hypnocyclicus thermotrophus TaxID=1627895 RepID=A0AA46I4X2_9FUSO|nr:site-2 protease family protein [Hypnocyclicus thermotrophus]TDT67892.1 Zn-dependent protease [Hypnocyclicus thermotrophus]
MKDFLEEIKRNNPNIPKITKYIYLGILGLIGLLIINSIIKNPLILAQILVLIISVSLHELAHGYIAYKFGDPTAKIAGRITLNPIKHIDLLGLLVPVLLIFSGAPFVIGWAKPIPVSYKILKDNKKAYFSVAIAGILTNLILVFLVATIIKFVSLNIVLANIMFYMIQINLILAIFNLIPIPPLDGSKILESFLDYRGKLYLQNIEKYGFIIIIVLLYTGMLERLMMPIYNLFLIIIKIYIN